MDVDLSVAAPEAPEVEARPITDDPDAGPSLEDLELEPAGPVEPVTEDTVRMMLRGLGGAMHGAGAQLAPDDPAFLTFTEPELDQLTPPLTAVVNRRPRLQAAVARGDQLSLMLALAGWTGRNIASYQRHTAQENTADEPNQRREARSPARRAVAPAPVQRFNGWTDDRQRGGPGPSDG